MSRPSFIIFDIEEGAYALGASESAIFGGCMQDTNKPAPKADAHLKTSPARPYRMA